MFNHSKNPEAVKNIVNMFSEYTFDKFFITNDNTCQAEESSTGNSLNMEFLSRQKSKEVVIKFKFNFNNNTVDYQKNYFPNRLKMINKFQKLYTPDFERVRLVMDSFINTAFRLNHIVKADKKEYEYSLNSHIMVSQYTGTMLFYSKNLYTLHFNKDYQKPTNIYHNKQGHYKKSYIEIETIFLVHSDNTVHAYFKLLLPINPSRKIVAIIPMSGEFKCYFANNYNTYFNQHIDEKTDFTTSVDHLDSDIYTIFIDELKRTVIRHLKLKKSDLDHCNEEQLKEYLILAEMMIV